MDSLKERLEKAKPGGAHTYSRGLEIYPENVPALFTKSKGAYTWSSDNKKFLDYSMALRSVILGYANDEVNSEVIKAIDAGNTFSRPSKIELDAAEKFIQTIPGAEMVKFAKNGSNVTTGAIKLARAATGRSLVLYPKEQPFFSFDDWFIANTKMNYGTINDGFSKQFEYGNIESVRDLINEHKDKVACIILEPSTHINPCSCQFKDWLPKDRCCGKPNFLSSLRKLCDENGIVLIFDEMITGARWRNDGAQSYFNVIPDLSTFGKAIANGYSIAALCGKREIMEYGGIRSKEKPRTFLLSSTHGAETTSLAALMKTTEIIERDKVCAHIWDYNTELITELNLLFQRNKVEENIWIEGNAYAPNILYKDGAGLTANQFKYIFLEKLISRGILMPWIATSFSHNEKDLSYTVQMVEEVLSEIERGIFELPLEDLKAIFRFKN